MVYLKIDLLVEDGDYGIPFSLLLSAKLRKR